MPTPAAPLLTVRDLAVTFGVRGQRAVHAVDEVSFEIRPGQHVGLDLTLGGALHAGVVSAAQSTVGGDGHVAGGLDVAAPAEQR